MDTPHPSYPPLDLAASGAVVVTNRRGIKSSLSRYSDNIICAGLGVGSLVEAIHAAAKLVSDETAKSSNYAGNSMFRDWNVALEPVVQRMAVLIRSENQ